MARLAPEGATVRPEDAEGAHTNSGESSCTFVLGQFGVKVAGHRPIRDARGLFHDEPDDLASTIEARGLKLLEEGRSGIPIGVLPYLEEEAIARLRHAIGALGEDEAAWKRDNWDHWRRMWVQEARYFMRHAMQGPVDATVAYSAAEVLARASDLRYAIEDGNAEKAAGLAMLVASWVFAGGVSIRLTVSERVAKTYKTAQRKKARLERTTVQTDDGGTRKRDLVRKAMQAAGGADATAPEVWEHLKSTLAAAGLNFVEDGAKGWRRLIPDSSNRDNGKKPLSFSLKGVQTMLRELRGDASSKPTRGRPKKKPA